MIRAAAFLVLFVFNAGLAWAENNFEKVLLRDAAGSADSAFTGRYEGSVILGQTQKAFDELVLASGPAAGKAFATTVSGQGRVTRTLYVSPVGRSSLEVFGNYLDALKGKGFTSVFECANDTCGKAFKDNLRFGIVSDGAEEPRKLVGYGMFNKILDPRYALLKMGEPGSETYVALFAAQNDGGRFGGVSSALRGRVGVLVEIVEPKSREDKIVTLSADEIGADLASAGRVVIYGIYFDTDKAVIKPESQEQLDQMVAYLKGHPEVKVYVTGHTDNQGGLDYNMKLSGGRAIAVTKALAVAGISAARLTPKAVGPLAPLAPNKDDAGRAKNRRVELVEQ